MKPIIKLHCMPADLKMSFVEVVVRGHCCNIYISFITVMFTDENCHANSSSSFLFFYFPMKIKSI